jgi:hypothetical protein
MLQVHIIARRTGAFVGGSSLRHHVLEYLASLRLGEPSERRFVPVGSQMIGLTTILGACGIRKGINGTKPAPIPERPAHTTLTLSSAPDCQ